MSTTKPKLLAFILASRFKRPIPLIQGTLVATHLNHGLPAVIFALLGLATILSTGAIMPDTMNPDSPSH